MATNNILPFADTATATDIYNDAQYVADTDQATGNKAGIAKRKLVNKALKQSSKIAAGVAQFIANNQANNITDALTTANIAAYLQTAITSLVSGIPRGLISGIIMSTAGSSATLTVAPGQASDSTNAVLMNLLAATAKTTAAWAVGSAVGGLDTGSIANNTFYHWYVIRRPDTGVVDVIYSLSASAPTLPANYTQYRRIGAAKTNGSAQWNKFVQIGDKFFWDTPINEANGLSNSSTAANITINVPTGIKVEALLTVASAASGNSTSAIAIYDISLTDPTVANTGAFSSITTSATNATGTTITGTECSAVTNTSAQVRVRGNGAGTYYINTRGWIDSRGKND